MEIRRLNATVSATAAFAIEELERHLAPFHAETRIELETSADELAPGGFTLQGDEQRGYRITGGDDTGVLYGAYALLERLGFRWFSPDPWDVERPERLQWPALDLAEQPRAQLRGFFAVEKRDTEAFLLWMARHRMNFWSANTNHPELCRKLGMVLRATPPSGAHRLIADYLPAPRHFAAHPEWFALIEGKRRACQERGDADNFCFSNEEAGRELARAFADELTDGRLKDAAFVAVAPFDNGRWCECDRCRALGNPMRQFLQVVWHCQRELKRRGRRVTLIVSAYHETLTPPDTPLPPDFDFASVLIQFFSIERCYAHAFADDNCPGNAQLKELLGKWRADGRFRLLIGEYYNVSTFASLAFPLDTFMAEDIEFYARCGACAFDYMHVSTALWGGVLALNNTSFADALWGRATDRDDFFARRYHAAAVAARRFHECLRQAFANAKCLKHYQGRGTAAGVREGGNPVKYRLVSRLLEPPADGELFYPGHFEYDRDWPGAPSLCTTVRMLDEAEQLLASAESAAVGDAVVLERLRIDRRRFDYTAAVTRFLHAFATVRLAEAAGDGDAARKAAEHLRAYGEPLRHETEMMRHIRAAGAPNLTLYANGLTVTQLQRPYVDVMAKYALPVPPLTPAERGEVVQG